MGSERHKAGTGAAFGHLDLEDLIENARDAIGFDDVDGRVIYANRAFRRLFRIGDDATDLGRLSDYVAADSAGRLMSMHTERMQDLQAPERYTFEARRRDGTRIWVEASVVPVLRDGQLIGTHCVIRDISEQRTREAALHDENRSLLALLESMPLAVHVLDRDGTVSAWNPASTDMFGWTPDEVLGRRYPLVPPRIEPEFERAIQASIETGAVARGRETTRLHQDGTAIEVAVWSTPLRGVDGRIESSLAVLVDISKQRHAQQNSYNMFESALDALIVFEPQTEIVLAVNAKACEVYGFPRERFVGMSLLDISDDAPRGRRAIERVLDEHAVPNFETIHRRADGSDMLIDSNASLVEYDGKIAILTINRDVTERRRLEQQLLQSQRREAIGELAAGVAHEFNNVLASVIATAESVLDVVDGPVAHERLHALIERAGHGAQLTRRLLTFGRGSSGKRISLSLDDSLREMKSLLERLLGNDMTLRIDPGAPHLSASADPGEIEQIILNLAMNSRDAARVRGTVHIRTRPLELLEDIATSVGNLPAGHYVRLDVEDDGCGMPDSVRELIFEPFFTTKPVGQGTGLGLSMVIGIMLDIGGSIDVTSAPGAGTKFKLYFPARDATPNENAPNLAAASVGGTETILVVDDESLLRSSIGQILSVAGYHVLLAGSAAEARLMFEQARFPIDMLLTDISMPGGSGIELAESLLERSSGLRVLLMSGYTDHDLARDMPRSAFIEKPFNRTDLTRRIRRLLDEG